MVFSDTFELAKSRWYDSSSRILNDSSLVALIEYSTNRVGHFNSG